MPEPISLYAQQAWQLINHLAHEIGPRPAGSPAVQRALAFLREQLESWGYACENQDFCFADDQKFSPYYSLAAAFFLLAAWGVGAWPLVVIPLPFVVAALPEIWQYFQRRRPARQPAQNLLALPAQTRLEELDLILCAHVDTARQNPFSSKIGRSLQTNLFVMMQRVAWMVFFFALFFWIGFRIPLSVIRVVGNLSAMFAVFLIIMDVWEQCTHRNQFVPGALDNASGVAVLMVVADHLRQNPEIDRKVGFLFTDAEESGMWGAAAFAQRMQQAGLHTPLVVLDQVGAGDTIRLVQKETVDRVIRLMIKLLTIYKT